MVLSISLDFTTITRAGNIIFLATDTLLFFLICVCVLYVLVRDAFLRTNRRAIAMMLVRPSVCPIWDMDQWWFSKTGTVGTLLFSPSLPPTSLSVPSVPSPLSLPFRSLPPSPPFPMLPAPLQVGPPYCG